MKFIAIIQARMGSTRLPGKVLMPFHGKSIIQWVVERVKNATRLEKVIVSIPDTSDNDILESHLKASNYVIFRGSEDDLVKRFYDASRRYPSDAIIRVCADNPLICPKEVDRLINYFAVNKCDYAYNHIPLNNSYPDGLGAEICSSEILYRIHRKANKRSQREHVFNYIWDNQEQFKIKTFNPPDLLAHPELRFDVDTKKDYLNLLKKEYRISMSAHEIINIYLNQNS